MFSEIVLLFKRALKKEQLSTEHFVFRYSKYTRLGAKLKKDGLGNIISMEIWDVSPWPDDKVCMEFQITPDYIPALKTFINLYERQFGVQEEPPPISMLPKQRF